MQTKCLEKEVSAVRWPSYRGVYVLWCYKELHLLKIGLGAYPPEMCQGQSGEISIGTHGRKSIR